MSTGEKNRDTELRMKWWTKPAAFLLWMVISLIGMTLRVRILPSPSGDTTDWSQKQGVFCLWHNRTSVCLYVYRYILKPKYPLCILTSASKDGSMMAAIVKRFGVLSVRGSTHRRSVGALKGMVDMVNGGANICLTPDGSRGPIYQARPGAAKLASLTQVPLVPACVSYTRFWRINKAWDKYIIPMPFSKIYLRWGDAIHVPQDADDEMLAEINRELSVQMSHGVPDFDNINS